MPPKKRKQRVRKSTGDKSEDRDEAEVDSEYLAPVDVDEDKVADKPSFRKPAFMVFFVILVLVLSGVVYHSPASKAIVMPARVSNQLNLFGSDEGLRSPDIEKEGVWSKITMQREPGAQKTVIVLDNESLASAASISEVPTSNNSFIENITTALDLNVCGVEFDQPMPKWETSTEKIPEPLKPNEDSKEFELLVPQLENLIETVPEPLKLNTDSNEFQLPMLDWENLLEKIPKPWKLNTDGREFQVGDKLKAKGLTAKHPLVIIPGIVSTALESWSTAPKSRAIFREKVWGGFHMLEQVTLNRQAWLAALSLDPHTGLDPPDTRVRAVQGLDGASAFIQGYWIWAKVIENLAVVGYDQRNLALAAYDWRLALGNLEERDGYFSKLKATVEELRRRSEQKVVIVGHSMGSTVVLVVLATWFIDPVRTSFKWVESPKHGAGGPAWVKDNIEAFVSAAGTHLGVAKAMSAFLSGEMKDTVELNPAGEYALEKSFSRRERVTLFRSWPGSASMWIKGGDAIWGNATDAPDDLANRTHTHGNFISSRTAVGLGNMSVGTAGEWILQHMPSSFQKMMAENYSVGIERDEAVLERNDGVPATWSNPLESRLPIAPSMKVYCVYGHGKETERSYWYTEGKGATCAAVGTFSSQRPDPSCSIRENEGFEEKWIDREVSEETSVPKVRKGVGMGEGDGTVSLLSLGGMCVEGWKRKRWNPGGVKVITVELPHRPTTTLPRGGANTSDHVDILGSASLNELILKVALGVGDEIEDSFVSNIREYAVRMKWD